VPLDLPAIRAQFPALARRTDGREVVRFDGPAGSQVPRRVIDAVAGYLERSNANTGGAFEAGVASDALIERARRAVADFLGADDPDLVVFGPNMTTLTLALARAFARTLRPGDEIVLTRLEHDANFTPWAEAARGAGAAVRIADIRQEDCTLDLAHLESLLGPRTRLLAVGAASNAVGTLNPVRRIAAAAHAVGAVVFVDAVHHAPHAAIDVRAWDCDFLCCSAYKFFGPHLGILWGRRELLAGLAPEKLRASPDELPLRWMPGTQSHEAIAGTLEAIEYLADLGRADAGSAVDRRRALVTAFDAIGAHERELSAHLLRTLGALPALRVFGPTDPVRLAERVPTVSFTHARRAPRELAHHLAAHGIAAWHGNFYALPLTAALGLEPEGLLRVGLLHYNTTEEIDRLGRTLAKLG